MSVVGAAMIDASAAANVASATIVFVALRATAEWPRTWTLHSV
jgi:hypothetical protein